MTVKYLINVRKDNHTINYPEPAPKTPEGVYLPGPCPHQTCNPNDVLWLPRLHDTDNESTVKKGQLGLHHYCKVCGLVKVDGDGRGRSEGYYLSMVSALSAHLAHNRTDHKLAKIDVRLICQQIRGNELFTDPYGSRRAVQEKVFVEVVMPTAFRCIENASASSKILGFSTDGEEGGSGQGGSEGIRGEV